ncbi:hypothetical protein [Psychroflexus montanilacus]|uniref:hypothetical protein n=1 Tax=Psychroflexus montanilacus TaxID=2873598 RepID=UPI001CCE91D5|nr:hypothetical protein [Psychroflexus montanilacus]MBZ9651207.1 hypothetical protein [Psychroflexus montanilacus]
MKILVTYTLTLVLSLQAFGLCASNVIKFSNLLDHYNFHSTEKENSFLEFIDLHYGIQKDAHENEHNEHDDLPYPDHHLLQHNFISEFDSVFNLDSPQDNKEPRHNFSYKALFITLYQIEILHPPKQELI